MKISQSKAALNGEKNMENPEKCHMCRDTVRKLFFALNSIFLKRISFVFIIDSKLKL